MKFLSGSLITLVVLATVFLPSSVNAASKTYAFTELFELVLEGDGYNSAMENAAWNDVTKIFFSCIKGGEFKIKEQSRKVKRERLLRGQQEEQQELLQLTANKENIAHQEEQERKLLDTCPNSCAGSTSSRCIRLCGGGGGRRLLEEIQERQRKLQSTITFDQVACEASMNKVLSNKYIKKNAGVTMKAYALV